MACFDTFQLWNIVLQRVKSEPHVCILQSLHSSRWWGYCGCINQSVTFSREFKLFRGLPGISLKVLTCTCCQKFVSPDFVLSWICLIHFRPVLFRDEVVMYHS